MIDQERVAGVKRQIADVQNAFRANGGKDSDAAIAKALGVNDTTVWRWRSGAEIPQKRNAEALAVLARIANFALRDDPEATKILWMVLDEGWTIRCLRDAVLVSSVSWLVPNHSEVA